MDDRFDDLSQDAAAKPFSMPWMIASVLIFTGVEIAIALFLAPAIFAGRLASPMLQMRLEMLMHLGSFVVGGFFVGLISPGVRLAEPAVGAVIAVVLVFLMSVFMPHSFLRFDLHKIFWGGGIACLLAVAGAYSAERWMGNVDNKDSRRARLRRRLWDEDGVLSRGDPRFLDSASSSRRTRR